MATLTKTETFEKASADFRQHLPDLSIPRFTVSKNQDAHEYVDDFKKNHVPPWLYNLTETWKELLAEPFNGVTNDGMPSLISRHATLVLIPTVRCCQA